MTDQGPTGDGDTVLTLQALIRARMEERGWSYADLAHRGGDELTRQRWQQLGTGVRTKAFPDPSTVAAMAQALEVDVTAVVLAVARSLGLEVRPRGSDLAQLLPAGTDRLSIDMRDAILAITRAAVAETLTQDDESADRGDKAASRQRGGSVLEWNKTAAARRNGVQRVGDDPV